MINLRLVAARVIDEVTQGRSLSDCLETSLSTILDARDRAFVQALCYGVCRFYTSLDVVLSYLLKKPLKAKDSDIHALLLVGLYQLMYMRIPSYAALSETVNAVLSLNKSWAKGLANAVLREYLRQKEQMDEKLKSDPEAHYAHPIWWIDAIKKAWPTHWEAILHANNEHPPFALRVNQANISRENYLEKLSEQSFSAQIIPETKTGIILSSPVLVEALPGFSEGDVSVQDGAAQLAEGLLEIKPELRILDACAAPGGKLMHILEQESNLSALIAVEKDARRIPAMKNNLKRLAKSSAKKTDSYAQLICHDVLDVEGWWDSKLFDRILLDAPCSASGVIRRHPDIKLLRKSDDITALANKQLQLLITLWPLLKVTGILIYVTCSIFPEENTLVLKRFLAKTSDASEEKIEADWGLACDIGRQILPGMHNMDGFYYAKLRKR